MPMPASRSSPQSSQRCEWSSASPPRQHHPLDAQLPPLRRASARRRPPSSSSRPLVAPDVAHQAAAVAAAVRIEDQDRQPRRSDRRAAAPGRRRSPVAGREPGRSSPLQLQEIVIGEPRQRRHVSRRRSQRSRAASRRGWPCPRLPLRGRQQGADRAQPQGTERGSEGAPQGRGRRIADGDPPPCDAAAPQPAELKPCPFPGNERSHHAEQERRAGAQEIGQSLPPRRRDRRRS